MQHSSYLYDYLALLEPVRSGVFEFHDKTLKELGLDPTAITISHRVSLQNTQYYLLEFKTPLRSQLGDEESLRLPISSHTINNQGLANVQKYHISIYKIPEVIQKRYISDLHLTLEYDKTYAVDSVIQPCTAHLYYEVKFNPGSVSLRLRKITVTDGARARLEKLHNSVKKECLNIMQRYASPILEAQHAWFQEVLINLAEDERNLRAKRSLCRRIITQRNLSTC